MTPGEFALLIGFLFMVLIAVALSSRVRTVEDQLTHTTRCLGALVLDTSPSDTVVLDHETLDRVGTWHVSIEYNKLGGAVVTVNWKGDDET